MKKEIVQVSEARSYIHVTPMYSLHDYVVDELNAIIESWYSHSSKDIVLNFKHVKYLYSRGITCLIRFHKLQQEKGRKIILVKVSKGVRNLLETTHITKIIPMYKTFEEYKNR